METLQLEQVKPTFDYLLSNWIDAAKAYVQYRESIQQDCIVNVDRLNEAMNQMLVLRGTMNFCKGKVAGYLVCLQNQVSDADYQLLRTEYQKAASDAHVWIDNLPDFGALGHINDVD